MKRFIAGVFLIVCAFTMVGWGSSYDNRDDKDSKRIHDRDEGREQADRSQQGDDEDIRRAQGDERGRTDIHVNKSHGDEEKDR